MTLILSAVLLLVLTFGADAFALDHEGQKDHKDKMKETPHGMRMPYTNGVTPYGDFCPRCNNYGVGKKQVTYKKANFALSDYFKSRGLTVKVIQSKGRFLKANVYRKGRLVDRVLFDRRSGRIRSIF